MSLIELSWTAKKAWTCLQIFKLIPWMSWSFIILKEVFKLIACMSLLLSFFKRTGQPSRFFSMPKGGRRRNTRWEWKASDFRHHLSCKYLPIDFQSAFCLMIIVHDCLSQDLLRVRCENCGQALDRKRGLKVATTLTCLICGHETEVAECLSHVQSFFSLLYFMNIFSIRWRAFHWRRSAGPACSPRSSSATSWTGPRASRLHKFARW